MAPVPTAVARAIPREVITKLWSQRVTRVSLKHLYTVGRHVLETKNNAAILIPAQFLHDELPIRLGQTLKMLNSSDIPHNMTSTPTFKRFREKCYEHISLLTSSPKPDTPETEEKFTSLLRIIQKQQRLNILSLGQAFKETVDATNIPMQQLDTPQTQNFFDHFYTMNLGTRLLIGEHLALHDQGRNLVQKISPLKVVEMAISDAKRICETHYKREAPEVKIISANPSVTTTYIEEHLHRILFEVLKNSLRATYDFHAGAHHLPPLNLFIVGGGEDVSIKLSDFGGGIPISASEKIWSYVYTSSPSHKEITWTEDKEAKINDYTDLPLVSYGHGLPVARLTSRYFGGDLSLVSMEGHGTDTFLSLPRDDTHLENIPELQESSSNSLNDDIMRLLTFSNKIGITADSAVPMA